MAAINAAVRIALVHLRSCANMFPDRVYRGAARALAASVKRAFAGRRTTAILTLGACVAAFAAGFVPARAAAATTGPGGVAGASLWYRGSDFTGTTWTDVSSAAVVASPPGGATSPSVISADSNYNTGVGFDGATQWLRGTVSVPLASKPFAAANNFMFVVAKSNVYAPSSTSFGDVLSGYNAGAGPSQGITYDNGAFGADTSTGYAGGLGPFTISSPAAVVSDVQYPTAGVGTNATMSENALSTSVSPAGAVTATQQFDIGGRTSGGATSNLFSGSIDEIVYYNNTSLSATQIKQIRTYLAIKYGVTLGYNPQTGTSSAVDYVSSAGATIWSSAANTGYQHNMGAIGRDDASGLSQLISHSGTAGNAVDLTIGNGTSLASPAAFSSDQTFLVWGDNGGSTTMANYAGIWRMGRIWLGQLSHGTANISFTVPASYFAGVNNPELWVWYGSPNGTPIYNLALTCTASICSATVPASVTGSYYFSFGQVALSGEVFEDPNYGGGAGRPASTTGCVGLSGVRLELYAAGAYVSSTTTAADGTYVFLVNLSTTYVIRAVTPTVSSRSGGSTAGIIAVQTFRTNASGGSAASVTDHVGGETPGLIDAGANTSNATFASLTTSTTTPESVTTATTPSTGGILSLNFGFNFDTIVNANSGGQGSFAQFIINANALGGVASLAQTNQTAATQTSIFMIGNGSAHSGLHTGTNLLGASNVAAIAISAALPAIANAGTVIDGATQTANVAANSGTWGTGGTVGTGSTALSTISRPTVQLTGTSSIATGLSIAASSVTVRGIAVWGFGTGGGTSSGQIVVGGGSPTGILIEKNVIGTSATAFSAGNGAGGNGVVAAAGGGTIRTNMIGYQSGVPVTLASTSGWTVSGNEIRSAQGSAAYAGIALSSMTATTLSGNLISASPAAGISADAGCSTLTVTNNTISGNGIGTTGAAPSQTPGIALGGSSNTVATNIISANYGAGILVANGATADRISQNSIYANGTVSAANGAAASGEIGIDLLGASDTVAGTSPFITPNRSGGVGTGGNNLFDFPVFDGAAIISGNLVVTGWARPGSTIEVYLADAAPASGFGQGKTYLTALTEGASSGTADTDSTATTYNAPGGKTNIGTDTTNRFKFTLAVPGGVSVGSIITANAYLAANGTSEFGANFVVGNSLGTPAVSTVLSVSPAAFQVPGGLLTYTGVFTNGGGAAAYAFAIVDPVPANTDFQIGSAATSLGTTSLTVTTQYSSDNGSTWTYSPVNGGGGAPAGYDRSVTQVRFVFTGSLDYNSPNNTGSFSLAVRIR